MCIAPQGRNFRGANNEIVYACTYSTMQCAQGNILIFELLNIPDRDVIVPHSRCA